MANAPINYIELQRIASNLIAALGSSYKLIRPSKEGERVLATGISGTFDRQMASTFSATNGGLSTMDRKVIYLPVIKSGKVEPQPEDRLIQGDKGYRVISVEVVRPDGKTTILYTCEVS